MFLPYLLVILAPAYINFVPTNVWYSEAGRLSVYWPGDGMNTGRLACGGRFKRDQVHIAYRRWPRVGCGRKVWVCSDATRRCWMAKVADAGPFGIYTGKLRRCRAEGRWKVWVKYKPPPGWKWRAVADFSYGLWKRLGKPKALTRVRLYFLRRWRNRSARRSARRAEMPDVSGKPKAGRGKTTIQTLIFSKERFKTAAAAKAWAKSHGYKSGAVDTTGASFRLRQFNPGHFQAGSFRTISIADGVKAVIGRPKTSVKKGAGARVAQAALDDTASRAAELLAVAVAVVKSRVNRS